MNNTHLHIIGSKPFYNLLNELDTNYTFSTDDNSKYNDKWYKFDDFTRTEPNSFMAVMDDIRNGGRASPELLLYRKKKYFQYINTACLPE